MGVYIRGMKMPTSCDECPMFNLDIDGGCYCTKYFVIRKKDQDRPDWCPLVPVPPHGRLIDADALEKDFASLIPWAIDNEIDTAYTDGLTSGYNALVNAPTIIPAEEGE